MRVIDSNFVSRFAEKSFSNLLPSMPKSSIVSPAFEKEAAATFQSVTLAHGISYRRAEAISENVVHLTTSYPDLIDFSRRSYSQTSVLAPTGSSSPNCQSHPELTSPSPLDPKLKAWARKAEVEFRAFESEKNQVTVEILIAGRPILRKAVTQAKDVYNGGAFGCPSIGSDFVAVMFEPADPKFAKGWWNSETDSSVVDKFKYIPSFGEAMTKSFNPQLMIITFDGQIRVVDAPEGYILASPAVCPAQGATEIIVVGYKQERKLQKPGLSVCFNRPAELFSVTWTTRDSNYAVNRISDRSTSFLSLAPVFSPSGSSFCFVGRDDTFLTHCTILDVYVVSRAEHGDWKTQRLDLAGRPVKAIPLNGETSPPCSSIGKPVYDAHAFPGLFQVLHEEGRTFRFLTDDRLVFHSNFYGESSVFVFDLKRQDAMYRLDFGNVSASLMDMTPDGRLIVQTSSFLLPQSLYSVKLVFSSEKRDVSAEVLALTPKQPSIEGYCIERVHTTNTTGWLLRNKDSDSHPILVKIHGGPHACAMNSFSQELACYLKSGFHVLLPNYRGSGGFGAQYLESLMGEVGETDVADCYDLIPHALDLLMGHGPMIAYGGSHGGFLTAWLLAKYPEVFKAGVLWNPVVDLLASNLTSDIPEWSVACVKGRAASLTACTASYDEEFLLKAKRRSAPISGVRSSSLVVLGAADQRVNSMAGLRWAQAVEETGTQVDVLWYPDQGHSIDGPEYNEHVIVSVLGWILEQCKRD